MLVKVLDVSNAQGRTHPKFDFRISAWTREDSSEPAKADFVFSRSIALRAGFQHHGSHLFAARSPCLRVRPRGSRIGPAVALAGPFIMLTLLLLQCRRRLDQSMDGGDAIVFTSTFRCLEAPSSVTQLQSYGDPDSWAERARSKSRMSSVRVCVRGTLDAFPTLELGTDTP